MADRVESAAYRPPYRGAAVAALAVFALYAITLAPSTQFWDTSEYIATAHILGIPHPPGNPLFVLLARTWDLLLAPTTIPVAARINLFSALMGALAHGCWFLVVHRTMSGLGRLPSGRVDSALGTRRSPSRRDVLSEDREGRAASAESRFPMLAASLAVLVSATAFTVWNQSNVNEKVYTVSLFAIAALSWIAFRWRDLLVEGRRGDVAVDARARRLVWLAIFVMALSVGNHLLTFLAAPALVVFLLVVRPRTLLDWRVYAVGVPLAVLGLSVHLFLPIRAGLHPIINEGAPETGPALLASINREQYQKPPITRDPTDPSWIEGRGTPRGGELLAAQYANYAQYFDWQWARSVSGNASPFGGARPVVTLVFVLLGLGGLVTQWRRDRAGALYLGALFFMLSLALTFYMNFKYGYSYATERYPDFHMHEVRERDYFYFPGFSVWGLWAGLGVAALYGWLAAAVSRWTRPALAWVVAAPVAAVAFLPLALNWKWASRAGDYAARDWAYNLLQSVEPYGVLFTNGDNDTFPLWYVQEVEGIRQDVTVIVTSYLQTGWYVKQLRALTTPCKPGQSPADARSRIVCQRPFRPEQAPAMAEAARATGGVRSPKDSILRLTDAEIAQVEVSYYRAPQPLTLRAGNVVGQIAAGTPISPSDTFMAAILANSVGDRPIHFSVPAPEASTLGIRDYLVWSGLTLALANGRPAADAAAGIVPLAQAPAPFIDVKRTDTLLTRVFAYHGLPGDRDVWSDSASRNMPSQYAYVLSALAQGYATLGDTVKMRQHLDQAEKWAKLGE